MAAILGTALVPILMRRGWSAVASARGGWAVAGSVAAGPLTILSVFGAQSVDKREGRGTVYSRKSYWRQIAEGKAAVYHNRSEMQNVAFMLGLWFSFFLWTHMCERRGSRVWDFKKINCINLILEFMLFIYYLSQLMESLVVLLLWLNQSYKPLHRLPKGGKKEYLEESACSLGLPLPTPESEEVYLWKSCTENRTLLSLPWYLRPVSPV